MNEQDELTIGTLKTIASQAGQPLTDDEAQELLSGTKRNLDMARQLRALVTPESEPRPIFQAQSTAEEANRG